jgi:hypothetical protein
VRPLSDVLSAIDQSRNAALLVGAGISIKSGIPGGYQLPIQFGQKHPALLKRFGLQDEWNAANSSNDWAVQATFVDSLVYAFQNSPELQQAMLAWLMKLKPMKGVFSNHKHKKHNYSLDHAIFVLTYFKRLFKHLITTNWDFLLEKPIDIDLYYDRAYENPFETVEFTLSNGRSCHVEADQLFYLTALDDDDYFWHPRWEIVASARDVATLARWKRPIWKIHGSPFFLACSECGGYNRWKHLHPAKVGDPCPVHPHIPLVPEIVFWGQGIDLADPIVWRALKARLRRCDLIVVSGFSGAGTDRYIREVLEAHGNTWLVSPDLGDWDQTKINYVNAYSSDLAIGLCDYICD